MRGYELPPDPHPGMFVTVDWGRKVVRCLRQLLPIETPDMKFDVTQNGTRYRPSGTGKGTQSRTELHPFAVRWMSYGGNDGEWQIYLPYGCATLKVDGNNGSVYNMIPVNKQAKDANGDEIFFWYRIEDPEDADAEIKSVGNRIVKQWTVYILAKPYPRMMLSTRKDKFKTIDKAVGVAVISERAEEKDGERTVVRTGSNIVFDSYAFTRDETKEFSVTYECDKGKEKDPEAEFTPSVINVNYLLGRSQVSASKTKVKIDDWESVCLKIGHKSETFTIDLEDTLGTSDEDYTCIEIYRMKDGVVTEDKRSDLDKIRFIN